MSDDITPASVTPVSVSVPAAKLREMLAAVIPHAADDDCLPDLEMVRFEVRDGTLFIAATDRYTMAVARYVIPGHAAVPVPDTATQIWSGEAREMHGLLERADGTAALGFTPEALTLDAGTGCQAGWKPDGEARFPDWRRLLAPMLTADTGPVADDRAVAPWHLARFIPAGPGDGKGACTEPLRARVTRNAVLVARGDWFLGALTLIRSEGSGTAVPWAGWAAVTAPAEAALAGPEAVSA